MNKQNILAVAVKRAMRVTESVGIGIVLLLTAAVIAMITPSAASAPPPSGSPPPPGWSRAWRVPRAAPSAPVARCTSPKAQPAGSRASIRRPGTITTFASGLPKRSRSSASAGRSTSRSSAGPRTHWSPSSAPTSAAATSSASTEWTAQTASPSSRTSARSP